MWFSSWADLGRVLVVGVLAYAALVVFLRVSGNRTLSKLNAFDFVVTVALGSTLATILLNRSVTLAEGVLALLMLVLLQYVITWCSVRARWFGKWVKSSPILLVHRGQIVQSAMQKARMIDDEVLAVLRNEGISDLGDVYAVILESDGSVSVIPEAGARLGALRNVRRFDASHEESSSPR
jgi:uncharacterized membrane protein YcaP (DUF421 family)